jgi:hypothetical protein
MTIDERAAKLNWELSERLFHGKGEESPQQIIARHIREAVAERDALLEEALSLRELGALEERTPIKGRNAQRYTNEANDIVARITAMIGGHDDA